MDHPDNLRREGVLKVKTLTLDAETSGVDTDNDRIITFFMRARNDGEIIYEENWVLDPGIEVPAEAAEVHGMTTEWIRENGRKDVEAAILDIVETLAEYVAKGFVVCGYNHSFDLAMLEAEHNRHYGFNLGFPEDTRYIDPCIFSRSFDRFKKGGHKLITVAQRNGIEVEEDRLHAADYDVEVTEKLVKIFLNRAWKELAKEREGMTPDEFITYLQSWQRTEKEKWADDLTQYFAKEGKVEDDGSPIIVEGRFPW